MMLLAGLGGEPDRSAEIEYVSHTFEGAKTDGKGENIATGSVQLSSNGDVAELTDIGSPAPALAGGEWHRDESSAGLGDDWEVRATLTSGTTPTSNAGLATWLRLDSNRVWGNARIDDTHGVGTTTSTLTFEWRLFGGSTIQKTVTGTIIRAVINA